MKKVLLAVILGILLVAGGCAMSNQNTQSKTQLSKIEVLQLADLTAKSEGIDIENYNITGCYYEYGNREKTWTVFYKLKPPTPPGGHFVVFVDDQTKNARLVRGE